MNKEERKMIKAAIDRIEGGHANIAKAILTTLTEDEQRIVSAARRLKEHCKTYTDCSGCQFYLDGCTIYGVPSEWEVDDEAD